MFVSKCQPTEEALTESVNRFSIVNEIGQERQRSIQQTENKPAGVLLFQYESSRVRKDFCADRVPRISLFSCLFIYK